ncbi:hypothetical protein TNCV_2204081 [Trichonephila clavipes]|nr:hypothetical protein TNCV_2204081 [Trichonephila clavipes]
MIARAGHLIKGRGFESHLEAAAASGQGMGSWQACHEFEPSTTKDQACRAAMHALNRRFPLGVRTVKQFSIPYHDSFHDAGNDKSGVFIWLSGMMAIGRTMELGGGYGASYHLGGKFLSFLAWLRA